MKRARLALAALVLLAACESERTIPTHNRPNGEVVPCVGVSGKRKLPGIDYDWSGRNAVWAILGVEFVAPPIMVLHHEFFCPIADTSHVVVRS